VREQGGRSSGNWGGRRDLRCEREAGGTSRRRPAVDREGGRREGSAAGTAVCGRGGPSGDRSTAGLPLDGEEDDFDFRCGDLSCKESEY
jgi:hypothetical protein